MAGDKRFIFAVSCFGFFLNVSGSGITTNGAHASPTTSSSSCAAPNGSVNPLLTGAYFPFEALSVPVPPWLGRNLTLLRTRVLRVGGADTKNGRIAYGLRTGRGVQAGAPWLELRQADHEASLHLVGDAPHIAGKGGLKVTLEACVKRTLVAQINLTLTRVTKEEIVGLCNKKELSDVCFWKNVSYQIVENTPSSNIGSLGPSYLMEMCNSESSKYSLSYSIPEEYEKCGLSVKNSGDSDGRLKTSRHLDREEPPGFCTALRSDSHLDYMVTTVPVYCKLVEDKVPARVWEIEKKNLTVKILDRNEHLPELQGIHEVLSLKKHKIKENDSFVFLLNDRDSTHHGNVCVSVSADPQDLWNVTCSYNDVVQHKWSWVHSFLTCFLTARRSVELKENGEYNVTLVIVDHSLDASNGTAQKGHLLVTVVAGDRRETNSNPAADMNSPKASPQYPSTAVTLPRSAARLARLLQPMNAVHAGLNFSLATDISDQPAPGPFNITNEGGIVYVSDPEALDQAPENIRLRISWVEEEEGAAGSPSELSIEVTVRNDTVPRSDPGAALESPCGRLSGEERKRHHEYCADAASPSACEAKCGHGSNGVQWTRPPANGHGLRQRLARLNMTSSSSGGCQWKRPKNSDDFNYRTCTPDITTCPDGTCDPLEAMYPELCPQDCWEVHNMPYGKSNPSGRGILRAIGVCTCNVGPVGCVCLDESTFPTRAFSARTPAFDEGPVRTSQFDQRAECGVACTLGVITGSALLLLLSTGLVCWRLRKVGKGRRERKLTASSTSMPTEYLEGGQLPDSHHLLMDGGPLAVPHALSAPDPKWEFPRSKLIIEQTLGEGEFGRVLRARALDIIGQPGYTTVAVKTLKADASSVELADLLSEYQLLKEVSHPNVVRLLGACTSPGAPVYVIIEFAEHGSLRSYLRKSRHIESERGTPCTWEPDADTDADGDAGAKMAAEDEAVAPATPRDILSFAWQISKGMAYLSDIKLVHRDLAARNVLVGSGRVCKISDFGLTRDVYEDDAYLKRSKGRVPVKWMALESLTDHVYTSKSDVWSFGVLLWELVTLGASPYPGVAVRNLFNLLKVGYRMERPENCSPPLYHVMRSCWHDDPSERPSFKQLTAIFEKMLEDDVEYLDLNPRIVHNRTYFTCLSGSKDVLEDDDLSYGNLNILPTDSVNYLTPHQRRFDQTPDRMQPAAEDEQRLLEISPQLTPIDSLDLPKALNPGTPERESTPRQGNAYLSPVHPRHSSRKGSNDPMASLALPLTQTYVNMDGGSRLGASQDSSPVASKVTPF